MKSFNTYDNLVKLSLIDTTPSTPVIEEVQELDVSDLLLEGTQVINAKRVYQDILHAIRLHSVSGRTETIPFGFYDAIAKLVTKALLKVVDSDVPLDSTIQKYLPNNDVRRITSRFKNIGRELNELYNKNQGWKWEDDEAEVRWFEKNSEGLTHPKNLPAWMFEGGNKSKGSKLKEDVFEWIPFKSDPSYDTEYDRIRFAGAVIELFEELLYEKNSASIYDPATQHIKHVEDFLTDTRLGREAAEKSGVGYATSKEDIVNYFLKAPVEHRLIKISRDYDNFLASLKDTNKEKALQTFKDPNKVKLLKSYNDGYKIYQLISRDACIVAGDMMDHCVGGYDPLLKNSRIIQLVGPDGDLHATIELGITEPDGEFNVVKQIKGKANSRLKPEYATMVRDFLAPFRSNPLTTWYRNDKGALSTFAAPLIEPSDYSYR